MSGFDANPFGDPFADPSITQATQSKTVNGQSGLEDYNPFANQSTRPTTQIRGAANPPQINASNFEPAVLNTSNVSPSNVNPPNQTYNTQSSTITTSELQRRQEELDRKAAELAAREEALRAGQINVRVNNWPPIPKFFPCNPCFYQDINFEIPVEFQRIVRWVYYLWMYYVIALLINVLGGIFLISSLPEYTGVFIYNLITFPIFTVLSYVCWFRPLYKAFRNDSSFNFMVFFFIFFCQIVLSVLWSIGLLGSCGLITAISVSGKGHIFLTIYTFLCTIAHTIFTLGSILVMIKVHNIYRSSGASLERAQAEFSQHVRGTAQEALRNPNIQKAATSAAQEALKNPQVQQAAAQAASNAARSAINQSFGVTGDSGNSGGNPGVRY